MRWLFGHRGYGCRLYPARACLRDGNLAAKGQDAALTWGFVGDFNYFVPIAWC